MVLLLPQGPLIVIYGSRLAARMRPAMMGSFNSPPYPPGRPPGLDRKLRLPPLLVNESPLCFSPLECSSRLRMHIVMMPFPIM